MTPRETVKHLPTRIYAKCGNVCSRCPSFKANLQTTEDRLRCSAGWEKYLGFRLKPDTLRACDGCHYPDDKNPTRYINCKTRKCAVFNGFLTCAECSGYPCEDLPSESVSREGVEARLGGPIPDEDYYAFVYPYEWRKHLDRIRASLSPRDIKEMKKVSGKPGVVGFPEDLSLPKKEAESYRHLHELLESVGTAEVYSFARKEALKQQRTNLLKLLWAFGSYGELKEGEYLVIDCHTYLAQKIHSNFSVLKGLFAALEDLGVHCEHVPLKEKGWLTPTGSLRPKGWFLKMNFDIKIGSKSTLKAFKGYVQKLKKKYGEKAYRYFSRANMKILGKNNGFEKQNAENMEF